MDSEVPRRCNDADLFSVILREAGVSKQSAIRITGRGGLAPLVWLCRHGFDDVAYVHLHSGAPRNPGDALILLDQTSLADLQELVADRCLLRPGGTLIVRTPDLREADGFDPAHATFERAGYVVRRCIARRSSELHVACKQEALARAA